MERLITDARDTEQIGDQLAILKEEYVDSKYISKEAENGIVMLPIYRLIPHPDNPRRELGDLTELAESIKARGVMQNLTVVPADGGYYRILIGHRRYTAARLAGLTELPCAVVDMPIRDQIAVMLAENMQRSDLSVYEQAQGVQMLMDLGDSVEGISEKTGFSQTTVRRRLKVAELDGEKLKKISSGRQITFGDFEKLGRIEDIEVRNSLLDKIGTADFDGAVKAAVRNEQLKKVEDVWRHVMSERGMTEIPYSEVFSGKYHSCGRPYAETNTVAAKDFPFEDDMQYFSFNRGTVYFRRDYTKEDSVKDEKEALDWQEHQAWLKVMDEAFARCYELRRDFVFGMNESQAKAAAVVIIEYAVRMKWEDGLDVLYRLYDHEAFAGYSLDARDGFESVKDTVKQKPYRSLLRHVYCMCGDSKQKRFRNWDGTYREDANLEFIYRFLEALGYEMSLEERMLRDGTSRMYERKTVT